MDPEIEAELRRLRVEISPWSGDADVRGRLRHADVVYEAKNERFLLTESGYERQFAQTYFCRYHEMKPHLEAAARKRWPQTRVSRILGIKETKAEDVAICGVFFKSMKLKPQVLDKYLSKRQVEEKELQKNKNRVREDDVLYLEDEGTRILLAGDALPVHHCVSGHITAPATRDVTGWCVAVKGRQLPDGRFEVLDTTLPGCAPQLKRATKCRGYLLLMSGLNLASPQLQSRLALDLLKEYLRAGDNPGIVRVVVCGGLIGRNEDLATGSPNSRPQLRALEPIKEVDGLIDKVLQSVPVDVMPGLHDPASFLLPQQRLHKCLFPRSSQRPDFTCATNPHSFSLGGVQVLGTSGQNVSDILLHSELPSGVEALQQCLQYRHIAPTCPDTLTCFPFNQSDPFVLDETPDVFFAGNQPSFQTHLYQDHDIACRLICVPDFSQTHEAVIVDLESCKAEKVVLNMSCMSS